MKAKFNGVPSLEHPGRIVLCEEPSKETFKGDAATQASHVSTLALRDLVQSVLQ